MGANIRFCGHGVAHEAADPAIPVREGVDKVEAMVSGRHRKNACSLTHARESKAVFEISHEVAYVFA